MGTRSTELADRFEQAVAELKTAVEGCTEEQWGAVCDPEGWTVGQTAQHISGQFVKEMAFITACAEGRPLPGLTLDELNEMNESRADQNRHVTRKEVLAELATTAPSVSAYVGALSDDQLDRTGALGLAGGATVSTQQLIEGGVLIAHVTEHLASIRGAKIPATSRI